MLPGRLPWGAAAAVGMRGRASVQQSNLREEGSRHTTPKITPILSFSVILSFSGNVSYYVNRKTVLNCRRHTDFRRHPETTVFSAFDDARGVIIIMMSQAARV